MPDRGPAPFEQWFESLPPVARAKVTRAVAQISLGNFGDFKAVGGGVLERRIHWGPGLRLYFAPGNRKTVWLLCGGTKRSQRQDVQRASRLWDRAH